VLQAIKVRLYPTIEQQIALSAVRKVVLNYALNACIQHYEETGKSLNLAFTKVFYLNK